MPDITTRLRQTRADMIGTADEQHYWDCYDAAAAIERLQLTDAEREAVEYYIGTGGPDAVDATLRTLLERTK